MTGYFPMTEAEAAGLLKDENRAAVRISGCPVEHFSEYGPVALSSCRMEKVTRYVPDDMTVVVQAGMRIDELENRLLAKGQHLAFEPPHEVPRGAGSCLTVGAVVAMNLSGPRRPFSGAARDSVAGLRFVTGLGEIVATGGRVIKSAAGLNLSRALTGSYGCLGFITEVTLRVTAVPRYEPTVLVPGLSAGELPALISNALRSGVEVTGAAHLSARVAAEIRLGEIDTAVIRLRSVASIRGISDASHLKTGESPMPSPGVWAAIRDVRPLGARSGTLWRISPPARDGGAIANRLIDLGADTLMDWYGGLIWVRARAERCANAVQAYLSQQQGAVVCRIADCPSLTACATRLPEPMRRLKRALDPCGVFDSAPFLNRFQS